MKNSHDISILKYVLFIFSKSAVNFFFLFYSKKSVEKKVE